MGLEDSAHPASVCVIRGSSLPSSRGIMRILFIGDIVGTPGVNFVRKAVPELIRRERLDLVIANAENAAGGSGLDAAAVPPPARRRRRSHDPGRSRLQEGRDHRHAAERGTPVQAGQLPARGPRTRGRPSPRPATARPSPSSPSWAGRSCGPSIAPFTPPTACLPPSARRPASSSSMSTPRPPPTSTCSAITSRAGSAPCWGRIPTCRRRTSTSCPAAPRSFATSA